VRHLGRETVISNGHKALAAVDERRPLLAELKRVDERLRVLDPEALRLMYRV
jgi:hypothetical protein